MKLQLSISRSFSGLIAVLLLCTLVGCPTDDPIVPKATDVKSPASDLPKEDVAEPEDLVDDAAPEVDDEDTAPESDSTPADDTDETDTNDVAVSEDVEDDVEDTVVPDTTTEDATTEDATTEDATTEDATSTEDSVEDLGPQGPPDICIGISPPKSAFDPIDPPPAEEDASGAQEDADNTDSDDAGEPLPDPVPIIGEPWPNWSLYDFQPQSCGYTGTYGLDVYTGHVTVIVLLAAW